MMVRTVSMKTPLTLEKEFKPYGIGNVIAMLRMRRQKTIRRDDLLLLEFSDTLHYPRRAAIFGTN